ncbi:hypothetical protein [Bacillus altitudinis]|uniref:hypothetical protein n=1 Tax=Bacillus altitudinis TaxID=293387 RepID=UPI0009329367|nr:hypothetical protein [Bacillus altitudinis]OJT56776.1 hypothetical protein BFP48_13330 [Bacillus altitudinis]
MTETINICYIDDTLDNMLSRYLDKYCKLYSRDKKNGYNLVFSNYAFSEVDNYKSLLKNTTVTKSNIIIIDSRLFENQNSPLSKFTGEEFKIILRQVLPFIKTIVISQNDSDDRSLTIRKYRSIGSFDSQKDSEEFYAKELGPLLELNIKSTIEEFAVLGKIEEDKEIDQVLISTIQTTIKGIQDKALFEKEDLDKLILLFNEVKENYENKN